MRRVEDANGPRVRLAAHVLEILKAARTYICIIGAGSWRANEGTVIETSIRLTLSCPAYNGRLNGDGDGFAMRFSRSK